MLNQNVKQATISSPVSISLVVDNPSAKIPAALSTATPTLIIIVLTVTTILLFFLLIFSRRRKRHSPT